MIHIDPKHIPFALSLLPFLALGIGLPPTLQDWIRGRMLGGDGIALAVGSVIVVAWYGAILHSVKSRKRDGRSSLLGRELSSWLWAPPLTFVVGLGLGVVILLS